MGNFLNCALSVKKLGTMDNTVFIAFQFIWMILTLIPMIKSGWCAIPAILGYQIYLSPIESYSMWRKKRKLLYKPTQTGKRRKF